MTAHYIDITPTWESGEKQYAWTELERMARAADAAVAMNKATKPEARR
jgi:hypothetical protein